jgi:hypothetical protein
MSRVFLNRAGPDVPLAILAVAFFVALAFQTVQLVRDAEQLATIERSQDGPLQETAKLRQNTDGLVNEVLQLAQSGSASAKQVVDEMAKQNIALRVAPAGEAPHSP